MTKRRRVEMIDHLEEHIVNENGKPFQEDDVLEYLSQPLGKQVFLNKIYRKKAFVSHGPIERFESLIQNGLLDLDIMNLLEDTPSENIQAWVKTKCGKIESVSVESPHAGKVLYDAGYSLYCRAPLSLSELLIPQLAKDIGMGFTSTTTSGDLNGEIELFCARKGHVTDWHFDFMENFTIQLQGSKIWKLKKNDLQHVQRGCTPHYKTQQVVEEQMKIHRMQDANFKYGPVGCETEFEEILLNEGDVFYFPSGMWHRVECTEDSISINLSMFTTSHADIVTSALRQIMWKFPKWRAGISYSTHQEARDTMSELLLDLKQQVNNLTVDMLLPNALLEQTVPIEEPDDEDTESNESNIVHLNESFQVKVDFQMISQLKRNPLSVLIHKSEIPAIHSNDSQESDDVYILHQHFGGSDLASRLRVEFICYENQAKALNWLRDQSIVTVSELLAKYPGLHTTRLVSMLIHYGVFNVVN